MAFKIFHGSIRKKLVILVLLATLPAFFVNLIGELDNKKHAVDRAKYDASIYLQGFSQIQQRITASTETLLQTISLMPEVRNLDTAKIQVILSTLLKANPIYSNAILVDLKGNVLTAGKGTERAKKFNYADLKQFKDAIATGSFSFGEFVVGKNTGKSFFPFGIPVMGLNGKVGGVIIIGVSVNHYAKLFDESDYPKGSFFGICDNKGIRIFRYPFIKGTSIGTQIKPNIFNFAKDKGSPGLLEVVDSIGVDRIIAFAPLKIDSDSHPYMYMFMGLDAKLALQKADWIMTRGAVTTFFSVSLALFIAWFVGGRGIADSMEKLAAATRRLGQKGERAVSGIDYSDGEVGYLAQTLDGMTNLLHEREVERNEALKLLTESEEQHRILLEANPSGICLVNPETRVLEFANPSFMNLLELNEMQVGTLSIFELQKIMNIQISEADFQLHLQGDGWVSSAVHCITQSGKAVVVDILSVRLKIRGCEYLAGFFIDITERKRFENELLSAKEEAEHANAAKDDFLANISHEVRTPLNGVMGMLQLMQNTGLNSEQSDYVDIGLRSSHSLMRVLDDLLDFSKIEAGMLDVYDEPFILEELMNQCVDLLKVQADEKSIALGTNIDVSAKEMYLGDAGRLRQILFNLLGNSIKFTENGTIDVNIFSLPSSDPDKERLFFVVKDTGVGIPDDRISDIFESFTQVDGSRSRKFQGVGLGLSIVKRLVSLMNGTMTIESELGKGTTVQFCVLVGTNVPEKDNADNDLVVGQPKKTLSLLLVEDEKVNRMMAKRILEKMGHRVVCAENGKECLGLIKNDKYDVVLMDIQMPVMTGLEATQAIRGSVEFGNVSSIPIVALTAHATKGDRLAAFDLGMNDYITKPFERDVLEEVLQRLTSV